MVIVAAVDQSDRSSIVVKEAELLGEAFDDTVHIVHVVNPSETEIRQKAEKRDSSFSHQDDAVDIAKDSFTNIEVPYETVGLVGDPADEVLAYTDEQNTRYLVVAGRKRSPVGKAVLGSVSQSLILNAECPVTSVIK